MMSRYDYTIVKFLNKLGYQEAVTNETPDFIVFGGGADVCPYLYDEEPKPRVFSDKDNDYQDFSTVIAAKLKQIPMLGICRGLQLLHVARGGSLVQHIDGHGGTIHKLLTPEKQEIAGWEGITINSAHHQCVPADQVGYAEKVFVSGEGITEVVVATNLGFLGVQYHPEYVNCPKEGIDFFVELMKNDFEGIL